MKGSLFFTLLFALLVGTVDLAGQGLRVNGQANYVFDDSFDNYYSTNSYIEGRINGGLQWGVGLEYQPNELYGIELIYINHQTEAPIRYWRQGDQNRVVDLGIHYILLGGRRYVPVNEMLEGYGGFMAGMVIFDIKNPSFGEPGSISKLALGGRLGGNLWLTEAVGLNANVQFLTAVQAFGGSFYFGTGGSGAGVSTYSTIFQFSLGGGLVIRLGQ